MNYEEAYEKLERYGQLHVLKYYDGLPEEKKAALLGQIEGLDFSILQYCKENTTNQKGEIAPLAAMQLPEIEKKKETFMKQNLLNLTGDVENFVGKSILNYMTDI